MGEATVLEALLAFLGAAAALAAALATVGWQRAARLEGEARRVRVVRRATEELAGPVVEVTPVPQGDTLISGRSP